MSEGAPKISIEGLAIAFGKNAVLRGVDLDLDAGRSLVVIGASGSGKSVLLKCILGILRPDKGAIRIDGEDILRISERRRARATAQIGMLFQGAALFDSLKVWENVAFRLLYSEQKKASAARARAIECLAKVGLAPEVGELSPSALSGGMQKRVALARAIAAGPDVLFFDEPTTGLDPITADVINSLISEQVRALGATAVSITHDMVSARKIADEVAMIHEGKIVWRGAASELDTTDNPMVRQFVEGRADGPIKMKMRKA
ncbi:MAG TPA: ATP-binding cassette domain-containing protein [Parvularculaceae bacterium]|nr:ATP-binding cassette domain-containing protein [Parvularculaceae bacterium]